MCIDLGMPRAISSKNNEETTKSTLVSCLLILKDKSISIKSLPGYENLGLRKRDLKSYEENEKCSIKSKD